MARTEEVIFTDEELAVLRRFANSLGDLGIMAALAIEAVESSSGAAKILDEALSLVLKDIRQAEREDLSDSAVSVDVVVRLMRRLGTLFPEDFVPSEETVQKCLTVFWENRREEARWEN